MEQEPLTPPPGAWYEERPDGFVVSASTRPQWFVILYFSVWVFIWLGLVSNVTPMMWNQPAIGAKVMISILWLVVALQVYLWMLMIFGRYVLTVKGDRAKLVLAIGPLRWRRRFDWSGVTSISWQRSPRKGAPPWILLSGRRRIRFGSVFRTDRRHYVYEVLQRELERR